MLKIKHKNKKVVSMWLNYGHLNILLNFFLDSVIFFTVKYNFQKTVLTRSH